MSPGRIVRKIGIDGVQYVVVGNDESSPLLHKHAGRQDDQSRISQSWIALLVSIGCAFGLMVLTASHLSEQDRWPVFHSNNRVPPTEGEAPTIETQERQCNGYTCFERMRMRVSENRPNFPSFWNYAGPISVTYDERSLLLNGDRALFLSGSLHPVRATAQTWESALDNAVRQGLNMVTLYVFWAAHQPFPDVDLDWSLPGGGWNLASAIRAAANRGLFVHIRLGPYVCAEYSYGGIPEWVPLGKQDMVMRRFNREWMEAMETFVVETVNYLTRERLWAYQGGPIIIGQVENELGSEDEELEFHVDNRVDTTDEAQSSTIQDYADWCGNLVTRVAPKVVWTMCNGLTVANTINTCNGYGGTGCSTTWLETHGQSGRIQVDQPALWTEDEEGFQIWGDEPSKPSDYFWGRTARDLAREGLQWFARGGSHLNYYMWWGGHNLGRAAASGIMNNYATDACLCSSGQRRQPKYGHLQEFHEAIASIASVLLSATTALGRAQAVEYKSRDGNWSTSSKQRMFVYNKGAPEKEHEVAQSAGVQRVIFVENDAESEVVVRVPLHQEGRKKTIKMAPSSSVVLADGMLSFDSGTINPHHKSYKRKIVRNAAQLLDWATWTEPTGASANDEQTIVAPKPIEQTALMMESKTWSDFAWYETDVNVVSHIKNATISIGTQKGIALSVFVDDQFVRPVDNHEHAEGDITLSAHLGTLSSGRHKISILSESLGYHNLIGRWGASTKAKTKGITGEVVISGQSTHSDQMDFTQILVDGREWRSHPGLHEEHGAGPPLSRKLWHRHKKPLTSSTFPPCSWASALFDSPNYDPNIQALFLDITSGRARLWLNGHDLGRVWNITRGDTTEYSQRYYFLPKELLYQNGMLNEITIFKALGGDVSTTNLVLSWMDTDESSSLEDQVDFPSACI